MVQEVININLEQLSMCKCHVINVDDALLLKIDYFECVINVGNKNLKRRRDGVTILAF